MNPYASQKKSYKEIEILSAPPVVLIVKLYNAILVNLQKAKLHIGRGEIDKKGIHLAKAGDIVMELLGSLNFDEGEEIAEKLSGLYVYFQQELLEINRTMDVERLDRLYIMVKELHDAWEEVSRQVMSTPANEE